MAVGKVAGTGPAQVATMSSCCLGQVPTCPCHSLLPSLLQEFRACGWMVDAGCSCPAGRQDNHFPFAAQNQTIGTVLEKTGSEWGFPERIEKTAKRAPKWRSCACIRGWACLCWAVLKVTLCSSSRCARSVVPTELPGGSCSHHSLSDIFSQAPLPTLQQENFPLEITCMEPCQPVSI